MAINRPVIKAIFFDAMGTLISLKHSVGENYAQIGRQLGLDLNERQLDSAFQKVWRKLPLRPAIDGPREEDDKGWWRDLVFRLLNDVAPKLTELDRDNFFELAYDHFAEPDVWQSQPDAIEVLTNLQQRFRLAVVSNFDGRLRFVFEHLGLRPFFEQLFLSSELGADKPDPEIFRRALRFMNLQATEVLHVGDHPQHDWAAAEAAGLEVFRLDQNQKRLRDLPDALRH